MIIEGQLLLVILIVAALVITVIGVYVRFAMRAPSGTDETLSGLTEDDDAASSSEDVGAELPDLPGEVTADGLPGIDAPQFSESSLPGIPAIGSPAMATTMDGSASDKKGLVSGIGDGLTGLVGNRKSKDKIKEEIKLIDNQLEAVLRQSEEIGIGSTSTPDSLPADLTLPTNLASGPAPDLAMDGLSLTLPDIAPDAMQGNMSDSMPSIMPGAMPEIGIGTPLPESQSSEAVKKLCKEYVMPDAPVLPGDEKLPINPQDLSPDKDGNKDALKTPKDAKNKQQVVQVGDFTGKAGDASDDLLNDLELEANKVEEIDMSIMKEYRDMSINCLDLEGDLKDILNDITTKANAARDSRS